MRGRSSVLLVTSLALAILLSFGRVASAQVSTDRAGSILVFPKIVADASRDTLIQIVNTGTMALALRCFYVNAGGTCSVDPGVSCQLDSECIAASGNPADSCIRQCTPSDFDLILTRGQPTVWRASTGRLTNLLDPKCGRGDDCTCTTGTGLGASSISCPGFDPAPGIGIFPLASGFQGQLKCVSVANDFASPMGSNKLIGTAILENLVTGQTSQYNALSITANPTGTDISGDLELDDVEYSRCPGAQILTHYADGGSDDLSGAEVSTELTLVPCTDLLGNDPSGLGTRARALFQIVDEFESAFSADLPFDCALTAQLSTINFVFSTPIIPSTFAKTRIRSPSGLTCLTGTNRGLSCNDDSDCPGASSSPTGISLGCRAWTGLLGLAEERHSILGGPAGTGALKLHIEDGSGTDDLISIDFD